MEGERVIRGDWATRHVFIGTKRLLPGASQKVYNHSPDGFNWGYAGSGPAQLALALMLHYLPRDKAVPLYQRFKWDVIAKLRQSDFEILEVDVMRWIMCIQKGGTDERSEL